MRKALVNVLTERMSEDSSIFVLTADTGFHVFDEFQQEFADRFLNVGISEAAMIGMSAGLAHAGNQVFVYGIVPFVTMRCFEQIRVDVCYADLPVRIVGVGGGLTYGPAGMTHHSVEDIALMSCLPNMTALCPGDPIEADMAVRASLWLRGPCYLRLGKTGEPTVHRQGLETFEIGKGIQLRKGRDVAILTTGNMLATAAEASELLATGGVHPELISMHTVKPLDRELLLDAAERCGRVVTVEEHSRIGGLGAAAAAILAEENTAARLCMIALPDRYETLAGDQDFLREQHGLTASAIADRTRAFISDTTGGDNG